MNLEKLQRRLPAFIVGGGVATGLAGFADTMVNRRYGVDLGLRGMLPEPLDVADHGMSWLAGATISLHSYIGNLRRDSKESLATLDNPDASVVDRHEGVSGMRRAIAGAAIAGMAAGTFYITVGEVGSEALHVFYDRKEAKLPEKEREPLPLGHFDPIDMLYGVGAAVAVAKLKAKNDNAKLSAYEATLPKLKQQHRPANLSKPAPKANKRYTPPKRK